MNNKNTTHTVRKEEIKRGLSYALILCIAMFMISALIFHNLRSTIYEEIDEKQYEELFDMEREIHAEVNRMETYIYYLSLFPQTIRSFALDPASMDDSALMMSTISEYCHCFDQIRLIDAQGMEIIRVNMKKDGSSEIVGKSELQNKHDRYYFKESMQLEPDELYISPLDLNIEHDQVEIPHKPMIRMGRAVFDDDGQRLGVVIINYKASALISLIESINIHEGDEWLLINDQGYYLHEPAGEKEFGFMFSDKQDTGFFNDEPEIWNTIQDQRIGKAISKDAWLYYLKMTPLEDSSKLSVQRDWHLIMKVPKNVLNNELETLYRGLIIGNGLILPLLMILGWFLGRSQVRNKYYQEVLEVQARVDPMTGLLNRRSIHEQLVYNIDLAIRQNYDLSVVYLDINDLKTVNDKYGHEAGDRMIKSAAYAINRSIRNTDIAARMGGDEFLIIFPDCLGEQISIVMSRIEETFKQAGLDEVSIPWTLSWGSSHWEGAEDTIDDLIDRADTEMYKFKEEFRSKQN